MCSMAEAGCTCRSLTNGTLLNNTFDENSAYQSGGAVYDQDVTSDITDNTFSGNTAKTSAKSIYRQVLPLTHDVAAACLQTILVLNWCADGSVCPCCRNLCAGNLVDNIGITYDASASDVVVANSQPGKALCSKILRPWELIASTILDSTSACVYNATQSGNPAADATGNCDCQDLLAASASSVGLHAGTGLQVKWTTHAALLVFAPFSSTAGYVDFNPSGSSTSGVSTSVTSGVQRDGTASQAAASETRAAAASATGTNVTTTPSSSTSTVTSPSSSSSGSSSTSSGSPTKSGSTAGLINASSRKLL